MTNTPNVQVLNAVAELLLWMGEDRAADAIYATLEGDDEGATDDTGSWGAAFAA